MSLKGGVPGSVEEAEGESMRILRGWGRRGILDAGLEGTRVLVRRDVRYAAFLVWLGRRRGRQAAGDRRRRGRWPPRRRRRPCSPRGWATTTPDADRFAYDWMRTLVVRPYRVGQTLAVVAGHLILGGSAHRWWRVCRWLHAR